MAAIPFIDAGVVAVVGGRMKDTTPPAALAGAPVGGEGASVSALGAVSADAQAVALVAVEVVVDGAHGQRPRRALSIHASISSGSKRSR